VLRVASLDQVAAALGHPAEQLLELDHRPLTFAFLGGDYETVVVRDRTTGRIIEATVDAASGQRVDAAELRRRDRDLAVSLGTRLSAELRDLLLRHPDLPAVSVLVSRSGGSGRTALRAKARQIVTLAQDAGVLRIELLEEPEITD
jgi:aspartokinase